MAIENEEQYKWWKKQDQGDLTDAERQMIKEYEASKYKAPSKEDVEWAVRILNERDARKIAENRKNGKSDRAYNIIRQQDLARRLMNENGIDPWVRHVRSTPESVASDYNFNFKQAYENEKGEKLRATENDAKKLKDYIDSKMWDVNDPVDLQKVAYNMHMWNPNTSSWTEFIQSDDYKEFQKLLDDVKNYQTDVALDKIWNDGTLSNWIAKTTLPVSYEYAKKHYNDINGISDLAAPLAFDVGANLAMTGAPATRIASVPVREAVSFGLAPLVTEAGNVAVNDKEIGDAASDAVVGMSTNIFAPHAMSGAISKWTGGMRTAPNEISNAVKRVVATDAKMKKGYPVERHPGYWEANSKKGKVIYTDNPDDLDLAQKATIKPTSELESFLKKGKVVRNSELNEFNKNAHLVRGLKQSKTDKVMNSVDEWGAEEANKAAIANDLSKGTVSKLDPTVGTKESRMSYTGRLLGGTSGMPATYGINILGKPSIGVRGVNAFGRAILPEGLWDDSEEKAKELYRSLGLGE